MALEHDLEKAETGTTGTDSTKNESDLEARKMEEGAIGEPDSDHDEVEQMDAGHMEDLERQYVSYQSNLELIY